MSQRVALEPSYVLHTRAYRETSQLLELFSRDHGRVGLVARGARGARSRWKGSLQPFRPLLLSWTQRGELGTLTGMEQVAAPPVPAGEALFCGLYANELLMRFLHRGDSHPELFERYRELLTVLLEGCEIQRGLRLFERDLLRCCGFGLQLDADPATGEAIDAGRMYHYHPERGPQAVSAERGSNPPAVSGDALIALKSGDIKPEHLGDLKKLMRSLIQYQLGDKPLSAHALFQPAGR